MGSPSQRDRCYAQRQSYRCTVWSLVVSAVMLLAIWNITVASASMLELKRWMSESVRTQQSVTPRAEVLKATSKELPLTL